MLNVYAVARAMTEELGLGSRCDGSFQERGGGCMRVVQYSLLASRPRI